MKQKPTGNSSWLVSNNETIQIHKLSSLIQVLNSKADLQDSVLQDPPSTTSMSRDPSDSTNVMSKKPKLTDSSREDQESATGVTGREANNGFQELGFLVGAFSRESDGNPEKKNEPIVEEGGEEELGFDLNFPASDSGEGKEGSAQLGQKFLTVIDLEAENEVAEEKGELGFGYGGYGGNGCLGFGLGGEKGESFGEGVVGSVSSRRRRSSSREDKGKEKVGDGDWLQLGTGSKLLPAAATSGHSSGDKRSDSLSLGLK